MAPSLRLFEDVFANDAEAAILPALPRMVLVVHGSLTVADRTLHDGEAWNGESEVTLKAGATGMTLWRWELVTRDIGGAVAAKGVASREKLAAELHTIPSGPLLLRGDSVAFPPGGCAYLHRHQGPGIRCLLEGGIRIDTHGRSTSYGPGCAWYENGADGVFAQAADRPTRFIRVMILPASYMGKSSAEYLREEDKEKPRVQQYKIFADMALTAVGGKPPQ
jgi:hypothetical protein